MAQNSSVQDEAPAAATQGRHPFSVDLLGKFDPSTCDARRWIKRYEYYGSITNTIASDLAKFLGIYLVTGVAFDWFTNLTSEVRTNFDLLKAKFLQRFAKNIDRIQITSDLFQMKQKLKRPVREFVSDVQQLAELADVSDDDVLSAVNGGLLSHIRADLRRKPPTTLDKLIETAELSESAFSVHTPQINFSANSMNEMTKQFVDFHFADDSKETNAVNSLSSRTSPQNQEKSFHQDNSHTYDKSQNSHQHSNNKFQNRSSRNSTYSHNRGYSGMPSNSTYSRNRGYSGIPSNSTYSHNRGYTSRPQNSTRSANYQKCRASGKTTPHDFSKCSARTKICFFCGILGHIEPDCFKKQNQQQQ